jgi:ribonuclease P protein component
VTKRAPRGFGPELRVRRKAEYGRVFQRGVTVRDGIFKLVAARREGGGDTRLGTAVTRRNGGSVERNRIRRRIREAFRIVRPLLPPGLDLVVLPLELQREPAFGALQTSLVALARKALARIESSKPAPPAVP